MNAQSWFEMLDVRRNTYGDGEWTPLWVYEVSHSGVEFSDSYKEEIYRIRTLLAPVTNKVVLLEHWLDLDSDAVYPCVDKGHYCKPSSCYSDSSAEPAMGEYAVFGYAVGRGKSSDLLISQDLLASLRLVSDQETWIRPADGDLVVIKKEKDSNGKTVRISIRTEYLKDYLCARGMGLYIEEFRHRKEHDVDGRSITWHASPAVERNVLRNGKYEWEGWIFRHQDVHSWQQIADTGNVVLSAPQYYRVEGQLRKQLWINPASTSLIVADNAVTLEYYVKPNGEKHTISTLDDDEFGCIYLFFRLDLVGHVMAADVDIIWASRDVFRVRFPDGQNVLFGISRSEKCFCIASDIARLGFWEQNLAYGDNIRPEDQSEYVDSELFRNQMMCEYLHTKAPETEFVRLLEELGTVFHGKTGADLWQVGANNECAIKGVTRFCSIDQDGFVRLAKNITVVMIERLNSKALKQYINGRVETAQLKSIGLLSAAIFLIDSKIDGRKQVEFMRNVNRIRQADAHWMTPKDTEERIGAIAMKDNQTWIEKGVSLIEYANQGLQGLISGLSRE